MPEISRSALLPYSDQQVFALINDVAAYPEFMDGCVGTEVLVQGETFMEARLDLARRGLRYSLTTRNALAPPTSVVMTLLEGPFKSFSGQWTITALSDSACKVTLSMAFSLDSKALAVAAKTLFNPMADNLVDAIVKRAKTLYG